MKTTVIHFVAAMLIGASASAGEIVVRPQAAPKGSVVRLGDVAEIRGLENGAAERLAALPLLPAPAAGTQRFLRQRELQDMVAAHGEDMSQLRFIGAAQVAVQPRITAADPALPVAEAIGAKMQANGIESPAPPDNKSDRRDAMAHGRATSVDAGEGDSAASPSSEPIRRAIVEYLSAHGGNAEEWRATFSLGDRQRASFTAATSKPTCDGGTAPWTGKQRFVISFSTADGPVKMPLLTDVTLTQPVVVAVRPVARGALITAADVDVQSMDNAPGASGRRAPLHAVEDLVGMEASRAFQVGDLVYTDQISSPVLVKRGEAVTVVAQGGGIRVRTSARARQEGARGDLVQVESLDTKERYDARVTGLKEVSVLAPARTIDQAPQEAGTAARAADAEREVSVFRKYQRPQTAPPQPSAASKATAFRKLVDQNGKQNVQTR